MHARSYRGWVSFPTWKWGVLGEGRTGGFGLSRVEIEGDAGTLVNLTEVCAFQGGNGGVRWYAWVKLTEVGLFQGGNGGMVEPRQGM